MARDVQSLWDRFAASADQVPLHEWQRQILEERLAAHRAAGLVRARRRAAVGWGQVGTQVLATLALAASTTACKSTMSVPGDRDTGVADTLRSETQDASAAIDLPPAQPDSVAASEATPSAQCATQVLTADLFPVRGTARGPRVDGESCDNGLGTFFVGPGDNDPLENGDLAPYEQDYFTTVTYTGTVPADANGPGVYGFLLHAPANALSANLWGWTGASAPEVGTYDSATNCGRLEFDVTLPVPPGVVCTALYGPCDPGCSPAGEDSFVCMPEYPKLLYEARPAATCGTPQVSARGNWLLTITSVSPLPFPNGHQYFQTHGHLAATLVNLYDPSDSIVLSLDF